MSQHAVPLRIYFLVFAALLVLTFITIQVAFMDLGGVLNTFVALLIACTKATLVVLYFMHVRYSSPLTRIFITAGLVWFVILLVFTLSDYLTRQWLPSPEGWTAAL